MRVRRIETPLLALAASQREVGRMLSRESDRAVLQVCSLKELLGHEKEIVRRIGARHNGGLLFLLDPQRLLREVHVKLTPEAIKETQRAHPELFAPTARESAYDRVAKSKAEGAVGVTVNGLFRKVAA
jgi:hypothetical protein